MIFHANQATDLADIAPQLLQEGQNQSVWLFEGEMGAGKTTLIKALSRALGVISVVQSPTFGLVNEYTTQTGESIYHFDCYRLRNETEALDIGIDEYFASGDYCFIEWPDRIRDLWPATYFVVTIIIDSSGSRTISTKTV